MVNDTPSAGPSYRPPQVRYVGHLADLTQVIPPQKLTGSIDGVTYLGLALDS